MNDYPTDEELKKIAEWPLKTREDYIGLMEYVASIWKWGAEVKGKHIKTLRLATGGWSGNESIIQALNENYMFGMVCWQLSKRGGLHIYKLGTWAS